MNKNYSNTLIFLFLFLFALCKMSLSQENEIVVLEHAQKQLASFLEKIPNGMESEYGFNSRLEFKNAKLLNPINIILPSNDFYNNELIDTGKVNYFSTKHWNIPISVDDNICCFLQGHFTKNNFKVFTIGGNMIAQKFNTLYSRIPNCKNIQQSVIFFPTIKKSYLVFYDNNLNHYNSKCISLSESFDSNLIKEHSMYEIFIHCKHQLSQKNNKK